MAHYKKEIDDENMYIILMMKKNQKEKFTEISKFLYYIYNVKIYIS